MRMNPRTLSTIVLFICISAFGQVGPVPQSVKLAKTVFIDNETGDLSVADACHLILATTDLRWMADRESANLVLHFDRKISRADRTVSGDEISISITNAYSLDVTDKSGTNVWKGSVDLDTSNVRTDKTESSWILYLHRTPAAKLTEMFLKARSE